MSSKSIVIASLASCRIRSYIKIFTFGAITAAIFIGSAHQVSAQSTYENLVIDPATGNVTLQAEKTYTLLDTESILRTNSTSGSFVFNETGTPIFTNNGKIGESGNGADIPRSAVGNLDMSTIGQFINNGTVTFDETLKVSSAGLQNTGTINGNNNGGINSAGDIVNGTEGTLTGSISTATKVTNNGAITGLDGASALNAQNGSIVNYKDISGYNNITSQSLTNGTEANVLDTDNVNVASITNNGTMDVSNIGSQTLENTTTGTINNADSMTVSTSLINSGTIDNVDEINAPASLLNSGIISNGSTINANRGLTNRGTISNFKEIVVTGNNALQNTGTLQNINKISGNLSLAAPGRIEMTGNDYETTITGNLTSNDGTFAVRLAPVGGTPENDTYTVNGNAIINGGNVEVSDSTAGTGSYNPGDRWAFIKTPGTLSVNEELTVVTDPDFGLSPILKLNTSYDDSNYYLYLQRAKAYAPGAQTYNQEQFGEYLDTVGNQFVPGGDLENVLTKLDSLSPGEGVSPAARYAMAQMDGAVYGSMASMEVQNMTIVNNTLTNYLRPKDMFCFNQCSDSGCPQGMVPCPGIKFWGTWYGVDGYAKGDGNTFGGDYSVSGVLVGGDRYFTQNFRLGGFFAYGDTEYQVNGLNEQAKANSYKAGLYFVRQSDNGYLLGNFNYGWDNFNMTRNIAFLDRTNTAETSGKEWAFRIEKGFDIALERSIFQPFGAFQYLSLNTDAFSETGTGATALNVDESDYNSYRTEFGGRLLWGFENQCRTGNLFLQASWMHEYGDSYGTVTSSFNNANKANYNGDYKYTVNGVDLGQDWCNLGVGGDMTQNNITIFGGYDFMVSGKQNLHTGNVGLAYQF